MFVALSRWQSLLAEPSHRARVSLWAEPWEAVEHLGYVVLYEQLDPVVLHGDRACGLPVLSVWFGLDTKRVPGTSLILSREVTGCLPYHDLAVLPISTGIAINTVFYAALLWIPFAPFQLRRYMRIKRGRCLKCGYNLRHAGYSACPECGKELCEEGKQ